MLGKQPESCLRKLCISSGDKAPVWSVTAACGSPERMAAEGPVTAADVRCLNSEGFNWPNPKTRDLKVKADGEALRRNLQNPTDRSYPQPDTKKGKEEESDTHHSHDRGS